MTASLYLLFYEGRQCIYRSQFLHSFMALVGLDGHMGGDITLVVPWRGRMGFDGNCLRGRPCPVTGARTVQDNLLSVFTLCSAIRTLFLVE